MAAENLSEPPAESVDRPGRADGPAGAEVVRLSAARAARQARAGSPAAVRMRSAWSAPRLGWLAPQAGRKLAVGCIVVVYAWVASASTPFSTRALIGVLLPGALLGAIAYGRPPERIAPPESLDVTGFSYWILALALLFEWEASAFRENSNWLHPTLTDLVNPLLTPHPVRTGAFVIWLAAGWGLVKR